MNQEKQSATRILVIVVGGLAFIVIGLLCAGSALLLWKSSQVQREASVVIAEAEKELAQAEAELDAAIAEQKVRDKQDLKDGLSHNVYKATVVGAADGEMITVHRDGADHRVRIFGIDCPEDGQLFHNRAKQLTTELCLNENVIIEVEGQDEKGQETARVYLLDARKDVGKELLRAGLAWRLRGVEDVDLTDYELQAQKSRVGLWAEDDPVPPWTWRETGDDRQPGANDFPDQPLVVGGGTDNIVQANPEYVAQNDPPRRAAHFAFTVDPTLKAQDANSSSGNVPDRFVWQARRKYRIGERTHVLDYSLDGREHTLSAGGKTFELARGNYFRFHILPGPSLFVDQLPVVDTIGDAASEEVQSQVKAVFDAHPSRTKIPKASRTAIPEAKADSVSPAERNLKRLSEQLPN